MGSSDGVRRHFFTSGQVEADSAPTASAETSGIDFGKDVRTSVMNQSAGKVREERDARGVRRRLCVLDE